MNSSEDGIMLILCNFAGEAGCGRGGEDDAPHHAAPVRGLRGQHRRNGPHHGVAAQPRTAQQAGGHLRRLPAAHLSQVGVLLLPAHDGESPHGLGR